jgi:hypothetical protein
MTVHDYFSSEEERRA